MTDLAERALIHRATFYHHYEDKYDLLERCMDDVVEELVVGTTPGPDVLAEIEASLPQRNVQTFFEHLSEYARLYRVLLGEAGAGAFIARVRAYLEQDAWQSLEIMRPYADEAAVPEPISISFIASAYLGVAIWWLENGQPYTPRQMARYMMVLTAKGAYPAFGWHLPGE